MLEYASGIINILEKRSFDELDQRRMVNAPTKEEAKRVLFDTDMGESAAERESIEVMIEDNIGDLRKRLWEITGYEKPEIFYLLFMIFDALNLKLLLKKKYGKDKFKDMSFFSWSLVSPEKMEKRINNGSYKVKMKYVERMTSSALSMIEKFPESKIDSSLIENLVDKAFFETRVSIAKKVDPLALHVMRIEVDIANIKKALKEDTNHFIEGGNFSKGDVQKLLSLNEGEVSEGAKNFLEIYNLSLLIEKYKEEDSERYLERSLKRYLASLIFKEEKGSGSGVAKVFAFFYRKMNSYSNIRTIIFGKESGLSVDEIENSLLPL